VIEAAKNHPLVALREAYVFLKFSQGGGNTLGASSLDTMASITLNEILLVEKVLVLSAEEEFNSFLLG